MLCFNDSLDPVPFALSLPLLSLSPPSISPTPPIIPSIRSRRMSFFSRKKNVSYIPSSTVSTIASLPFFFFSSSQPGEASPTARHTARASPSRHRHVSLLLSLYTLPPPNRPYTRLPPFFAILSPPAQNLPGSYNQSSTSLRNPTNSPPSNSSSVNGLAAPQSTQQLPPQHQPPPAQSQSLPPPQQQQPRPVYPWTARRLNLLPPTFLSKNAPPSGPSPSPFPRYGHALPASATPAGELFLFGGLVHDSARNDLYVFSTRDLSATLLQTSGEIPSPRVGHAGALVSSVFLIWGGDTNTGGQDAPSEPQDDSLYLLNLGTSNLLIFLAPADKSLLHSSITRVDPRRGQWPRACWSLWPCRDDGQFQTLRLRWSGRRRVLE